VTGVDKNGALSIMYGIIRKMTGIDSGGGGAGEVRSHANEPVF